MRSILPLLVASEFLCCSLWFTGNVSLMDLAETRHLNSVFFAHLTSATQFGFITGTLIFALFTISDRLPPSQVFFYSSILAAVFNLGIIIPNIGETEILLFRFLTGIFIAGVYPVGMKIASDYYKEGLGRSLGFLLGALVIGTALPHLLKSIAFKLSSIYIVYATSLLAIIGGTIVLLFIPSGPYRQTGQKLKITGFLDGFRSREFRSAAFGYFGHMWELYTFWTFLPIILKTYNVYYPTAHLNVALLSFAIISIGGLACFLSGILSAYFGSKIVATFALLLSCLCCLASPLFLLSSDPALLIIFLFLWGFTVIADSPLFSALIAKAAPAETRGTSLTFVNCIGFLITIGSIEFINLLSDKISPGYLYILLAIGPVFGLINLVTNKRRSYKRKQLN